MKKKQLFKGLSATFGSILAVCSFMSALAYSREGDINQFLGITNGSTETGKSKYKSIEELHEAEKEYCNQTMEEGSVLLRNQNNALPLKNDKLHVTLFGNASVKNVFHGGSGGPSNSGLSLHDALKNNGFEVNEKVYQATESVAKMQSDGDVNEVDASIYNEADFNGYKDCAILVLARYGGEMNDQDAEDKTGVPELSFHEKEKALVEKIKNAGFEKVVVLLNTGYAMDLGWLETYNIDACMWIGYPGQYGFDAVAKMLKGESSPSGSLVDTYAANSLSSPAMQNFGDFKFSDLPNNMYHCEYLVYAEGIYVGYKYYETRYSDQVKGKNKATSSKGAFVDTNWNYASEVVYPFGYGLSYASFQQTLDSLTWNREEKKVIAKVTVKNTSDTYSGKDAIQLYASLPYETGEAEKSAIQLIGFAKTDNLAPGEEKQYTVEADDYVFATYDNKATNGRDTSKKGCYTFDKGDYTFAIGSDSHDALNNVLALENYTTLVDENGNSVSGNKNNAKSVSLAATDNTTYATSPYTGEVVSNQFDDIDINYFENNRVKYLTRSDWNTFPDAVTDLKADDDSSKTIRKFMTATSSLYQKPADAPDYKDYSSLMTKEITLKLVDMANISYDDPKWDTFINQLTVSDLALTFGDKHGHDAIESIGFPKGTQGDGPDGLQNSGTQPATLHPCENLAASTLNVDLLAKRGEFLAEDALYNSFCGVFGGGADMHRTPYGGRNFEYFSEDSTVAYYLGAAEAQKLAEGGLISMFKHFVGNDQEINRHGVATFMTEQTLRQSNARAFEGCLSTKGGSLGNMSSYNRIGVVSTACSEALMTTLLREEWGFKGISITDSSKDAASYLFTADAIEAGTTVFDNDGDRSTEVKNLLIKAKDGNIWKKVRAAVKSYFYAFSRSNLIHGMTSDSVVKNQTPWWQVGIITILSVVGALTLISLILYILFAFILKPKKEGE